MRDAAIRIEHGSLLFTADTTGIISVAVLPFKFSYCWTPQWRSGRGRIFRADVGLLGVMFERRTDLDLAWCAGYGRGAECLKRDAALIPDALAAARRIPY